MSLSFSGSQNANQGQLGGFAWQQACWHTQIIM
jgi:hypothetical protein